MNKWQYKYKVTLFTCSLFYVLYIVAPSWKVAKSRALRAYRGVSIFDHYCISSRLNYGASD